MYLRWERRSLQQVRFFWLLFSLLRGFYASAAFTRLRLLRACGSDANRSFKALGQKKLNESGCSSSCSVGECIMRYMAVLLGLMVAATVGLLGLIHSRRSMELQLNKASYFETVKHRVTNDVLKELKSSIVEANSRLDQTKKHVEELTKNVKAAQEVADGKKAELNTCNDELKQIKAGTDAIEAERNKSETEFQQKKATMMEQINNLKIEAEKRSKVCDYIIKTSVEGMKLCGIVPVLPAVEKPEAPKAA
ncbi:hypothetical protein PHYPO_G00006040 [Pangasianodon hypophthalmus]|uniref:Uncharacterized protein n=2 Tax=Pangasianodon hypophthalmus TaxID=310915 RepID=A0A5N5Q5Z4_PANHP|nr:hypothetical protein PHYPO_G00006040 [Pangasianodon hypophthalmus]